MKIRSLFNHENLTTGNKILWNRGEIAQYMSNFRSQITYCEMWLFEFSLFCESDMMRNGYLEVFLIRLDLEITRVSCINLTLASVHSVLACLLVLFPLCVIGRLCSVIVAVPGHLLYCTCS